MRKRWLLSVLVCAFSVCLIVVSRSYTQGLAVWTRVDAVIRCYSNVTAGATFRDPVVASSAASASAAATSGTPATSPLGARNASQDGTHSISQGAAAAEEDLQQEVSQDAGDDAGDDADNLNSGHPLFMPKMMSTHERQRRHIIHCFGLPPGVPDTVQDRFQRKTLVRGTGRLESLWRYLRARWPEKCGVAFAHDLITALLAVWNVDRLVQYEEQFPYVPLHPISFQNIIDTFRLAQEMNMPSPFPRFPQRTVSSMCISSGVLHVSCCLRVLYAAYILRSFCKYACACTRVTGLSVLPRLLHGT